MTPDLRSLLDIAVITARQAGTILLTREAAFTAIDSAEGRDVKLAADRKAEDLILAALAPTGLPILSEESGWNRPAVDRAFWVVDPLDGTANYQQGIPAWAISIGLVVDGKPVLGVVHDAVRAETFSGATGCGAWLNDTPITVSAVTEPGRGVLMTGLPTRRDFSEKALATFATAAAEWRKVRMFGSAALSLAYVSCGRADAYHEDNIMYWDVVAGCALVEAAGGNFHIAAAAPEAPRPVSAWNGKLPRLF